MTKKFDARLAALLSEMAVNITDKPISKKDASDVFTKGGNYGKYVMTGEEVAEIVKKLKEYTPSPLDWKEFRSDVLIRVVAEVRPQWKSNITNCTRAARVLYDKLRSLGIVQDERDGFTMDSGSGVEIEDDEISDEDAEKVAGAVSDELGRDEEAAPVKKTFKKSVEKASPDALTPIGEAIYNFVANAETSVTRKELDEWIKTEFGYEENGDKDEEGWAEAKMELVTLLATKVLFKDGDKIVASKPAAKEEDEEVEALEAPVDNEHIERDVIHNYLKGPMAPRYSME